MQGCCGCFLNNLSMLFNDRNDGTVSNVRKALFQEPSPDHALEDTVELTPSVQHEEVAMFMLTLCTSVFCKSIPSYAPSVFYIRLSCVHLILQILQLSSPLLLWWTKPQKSELSTFILCMSIHLLL
jgi:hypothetical protein